MRTHTTPQQQAQHPLPGGLVVEQQAVAGADTFAGARNPNFHHQLRIAVEATRRINRNLRTQT